MGGWVGWGIEIEIIRIKAVLSLYWTNIRQKLMPLGCVKNG